MIDLDSPQGKSIFAISDEDAVILEMAKQMTLADGETREILLLEAADHLAKMRELCLKGWKEPTSQLEAVALLQENLALLASLTPRADLTDTAHCPVCRTAVTAVFDKVRFCPECIEMVANGRFAINQQCGLWCI
ncbi:MAG: hypothetical protein AAF614_31400 [Chloroflexota bacterium]